MPKGKKQVKPRYNTPLLFILLAMVPLYGGYHPFVFLFGGVLLTLLVLYEIRRGKGLWLPVGLEAWSLYVLCACHLLSIPFAVSGGMAFLGFLRVLVWVLFFLCASTYSQEERELILDAVAWEGALLSALFTLLFLGNQAMGGGDLNGRIDGPFQYANTWALFQLVCLILFAFRKERKAVHWAAMAVLLCGIGLTGSRGVLLLLLPLAVLAVGRHLRGKGSLRPLLLGVGLAGLALVLAGILSGGLLLDRFLAIPSSSSLYGRLLYYGDGIRMILGHPLGLGRGGYFYQQALEQTGIYTLRSVHNEYLQFALDAGIPGGIASVVLAAALLLRPGLPLRQRMVIIVIVLHACLDFDYQFSIMMCLLLLCGAGGKTRWIPFPGRKEGARRPKALAAGAAGVLLSLCLLYFSGVYFLDFSGRIAWPWFPADLELAEKRLQTFSTPEEGEEAAREILESTELSMVAWDCLYEAARGRDDLMGMADAKYHYLRLNRYRGEVYLDFTALLEEAAARCSEDELPVLQDLAAKTILQIEEVKARTSPLAYRITDRPELAFADEITQRLTGIREKGREA